jgi:hypothetical protein
MIGLAGDDSIVNATLWMLLVLAIGVVLLMVAFTLVTHCARWCHRTMDRRFNSRSNIGPQI